MSSIHIIKFKITDFLYAFELKYLKEVGRFIDFFKLPSSVDYFEGLFNLRGNIIPVINLGKRLGHEYELNLIEEKKFIHLTDTIYTFIIPVDEIVGVKDYPINEVKSSDDNRELCSQIIIDDDEIISLVDVKQIIIPEDFKYEKKFIFKSVHALEDLGIEKREKEKSKIAFAILKFDEIYFGIEAKYIKQLLIADIESFKFSSFENIIAGELEFEKKLIEVINFKRFLNFKNKEDKNLHDHYIAVINYKESNVAFLIPEETEFIEIYENEILKEETFFSNFMFVEKVFKYNDKNVKIIDIPKLFEFLQKKRAIE